MGLSIHYELELPGTLSAHRAGRVLGQLRNFALTLPATRVSQIVRCSLGDLLRAPANTFDDLEQRFQSDAAGNLYEVDVALERVENRGRGAAIGFAVHAGRGCDAATFGFMRPGLTAAPNHFDDDLPWNSWWWRGSCETQYASVVSPAHLIACHLTVIHLLDEAERLGTTVTVRDDAEYWETRSVQRLLQQVDRANGIMARLL